MSNASPGDAAKGAPPPAEELRSRIEGSGKSKVEIARLCDMSRQTLYDLLNGERDFTAQTSSALGPVLGLAEDYWLDRQIEYDRARFGRGENVYAFYKAAKTTQRAPATLVDRDLKEAVKSGALRVEPELSARQIQPASLDLRFGGAAEGRTDAVPAAETGKAMSPPPDLVIEPGGVQVVRSLERIALSETLAGRIGCPSSFIKRRLLVHTGLQIDPGFEGPLVCCIQNASDRPVRLTADCVILSVEITRLAQAPETPFDALAGERLSDSSSDLLERGPYWISDFLPDDFGLMMEGQIHLDYDGRSGSVRASVGPVLTNGTPNEAPREICKRLVGRLAALATEREQDQAPWSKSYARQVEAARRHIAPRGTAEGAGALTLEDLERRIRPLTLRPSPDGEAPHYFLLNGQVVGSLPAARTSEPIPIDDIADALNVTREEATAVLNSGDVATLFRET